MVRLYGSIIALALLLGALFCATGALADEAATVAVPAVVTWGDLGTLNPAFQTEGDRVDTADVVDNPVTDSPLDTNAQLLMWQAILGFVATFIISAVNRFVPGISPDDNMKRAIMAFAVCAGIGILDTLIRGVLDPTNVTATVLVIFTAAIGFYNAWFRPAGLAGKIEGKAVEAPVLRVQ